MTSGMEFHSQIKLSIKGKDIFSHAMSRKTYVPDTHSQIATKGYTPAQNRVNQKEDRGNKTSGARKRQRETLIFWGRETLGWWRDKADRSFVREFPKMK